MLAINGKPVALVKEDVRLELRSPGRASFTVQASAPLKGLVTLDIGYNDSTLQRHFIGYVERCTAANSQQQVLFCRELAAILAKPLPLNLRHVDLRAVLEEISKHTGLKFRVPDSSYTRVKAPFFYSLATGYQAMDSLARVFSIDDLIWQQQGNGEVFVGKWADSFFGARAPLHLPTELFDGYQDNQSAMIAALPGMRPGATINQGERVTSVTLAGTQMALKWKTQKRAVERQFPELTGGYHLPRFAKVIAVPDAPAGAGVCDDFRPRFGVDLQVLGPDGEVDASLPVLSGVPLPVPVGGDEMGFYAFPEEGTTVVVCFAYGLPHKPYIQTVLPHGLTLPSVPKGDQVWQHSEACQQRVDADGNWLRQTDGTIQDKAVRREVEAMENTESFQSHTRTVDDHSTESVGGIKKIEALGALKLLSGGSASLAAVDDLHQATGRDLNLVVGQKLNATVGGDMEERIQGMRKSVSAASQQLIASQTWLGSEEINVLQLLGELLNLVQQMNIQLASHTHGPSPIPGNATTFTGNASYAIALSEKLTSITL